MRVSPEIRHTCGILHWRKQQAVYDVRYATGTASEVHERSIELPRWRFGRSLSGIDVVSASIETLGREIQRLPEIDLPDLGHSDVFRNGHEGRIVDAIQVA